MNTYTVDVRLSGSPIGQLTLVAPFGAMDAINQAATLVATALKNGAFNEQIRKQFLIVKSAADFDYTARRQN